MERKNGGFTLIELLIAITVLSIMAGVLLQAFVVGRRINAKARSDERVQDMARKAMEEIKGFPFEELERLGGEAAEAGAERIAGTDGEAAEAAENGDSAPTIVSIAGTDYHFREREDGKWELTSRYRRDGRPAGSGEADYLIQAVVDREPYSEEDKGTVYSVNQFEMPNIADVSSFQNIVLEPGMISREEELLAEELLVKVNPQEDEDEDGDGSGTGDVSGAAGGGSSGEEDAVIYKERDIKRYLSVNVSEENDDKLAVDVRLIYTVDGEGAGAARPDFADGLTIEKEILNVKKRIAENEKTGDTANRIYLFLPDDLEYGKAYISGSAGAGRQYEIYVISRRPDFSKSDIVLSSEGEPGALPGIEEDAWFKLYTNLAEEEPVSYNGAEDRLYHLTVTAYRAIYPESGEGTEGGEPEPGEGLLTLDSTKRK